MHPRWRLAEKMEVQEGGCQPLEATWIGEELEDFLYRSRHRLAQRKAARLHSLGTPGTRLQRFSYTANSVVLVADRDRVRRISHGAFRLRAGNYLLRQWCDTFLDQIRRLACVSPLRGAARRRNHGHFTGKSAVPPSRLVPCSRQIRGNVQSAADLF